MFTSKSDRKFSNINNNVKVLVPEEYNILISSDPTNGAKNITSDGSSFSINLEDGLKIPADAKNVTIEVQESTIWWTSPNIFTGINDKLYITAPRELDDVLTVYVITIPQGLYNLTALNESVLRELENAGAKITPDPVINLLADEATSKVEVRYNYVGIEIDFTQVDTFRDILGYNSQILGPNVTAPLIYLADNNAAFNTINSFLIHSDLVTQGLRINNNFNQALAQVQIDVRPGSQIVSKPFNPAKINAKHLAGATRTTMRFWLTDETNNLVNTNSEYWTARIVIKYLHPHFI